jgi:hypothetical protein
VAADTVLIVAAVGAGCVAVYQLIVSIVIWRSVQYSAGQKITQTAIIWLVPLLGAVVCHMMTRAHQPQNPSRKPFTDRGTEGDGPIGSPPTVD